MQILLNRKKWIILGSDSDEALRISKKYNISPLIASVILNRQITSDEDIGHYILKDESLFYDPFLLTDMQKAVDFIKKAVSKGTKIAVFGDYDVDGITSTYIVYDYLKLIGADVLYYIPDRADEGYGISQGAISYLKEKGVGLIITVDVGITATDETEFARKNGVDIIITDHHTPKETLPDAVAVINPKTEGNRYPNKDLAGVGVAYKLVYALSGCDKKIMEKYSEAAAIGTIADMVALKDENRFIAAFGLERLKSTDNIGLLSLMEVAGIEKNHISSSGISFSIAPRLNAAGRIASASLSVELLLEKDKINAMEIASRLDDDNKNRQTTEQQIMAEAEEIINKKKLYNDDVIVVAKEGWHHGVIGIVSSKITEKYYKPSTVISINDDGTAKASGRSIAGFNLFDALSNCSTHLTKFGGHDLAAGFSLDEKNIDLFREAINKYAKTIMTEDILTPKLIIDAVITPEDVSCKVAEELSILEPFGIGNKTPVFCVENALVTSIRTHKSGKHVFMTLEKGRKSFEAPAFNMGENMGDIIPGEQISVAGTININSFRGVDNVQFVIKDFKECDKGFITEESLRFIFINIKNYVSKNIFKIKIPELKEKIRLGGFNMGIGKIKTALNIFKELELISVMFEGDTLHITRGKNFYSKCNLDNSKTYRDEQEKNKLCKEG